LDKGHVKSAEPNMDNVISGKLEFLKMVKGEEDPTYKKLQARFLKLSPGSPFIEKILHTWKIQGIESAIQTYNKKSNRSQLSSTTTILTL
jgi:hypothetical protein